MTLATLSAPPRVCVLCGKKTKLMVEMEAAPVRDQPASSSAPYFYCTPCYVQGLSKKPTDGG